MTLGQQRQRCPVDEETCLRADQCPSVVAVEDEIDLAKPAIQDVLRDYINRKR